MQSFDHYPWNSEAERAALIADICMQLGVPPPAAAPVPAQRFVKKGFYMCCTTCNLAIEFCKCAFRERETASPDGAHSDLQKRIRDARVKAGGR